MKKRVKGKFHSKESADHAAEEVKGMGYEPVRENEVTISILAKPEDAGIIVRIFTNHSGEGIAVDIEQEP